MPSGGWGWAFLLGRVTFYFFGAEVLGMCLFSVWEKEV